LAFYAASAVLAPTHWTFKALFVAQLAGYVCALLTFIVPSTTRMVPMRLLNFLTLSLSASLVAWFHYAMGEKYIVWKPTVR
jgi:hypothetical protein